MFLFVKANENDHDLGSKSNRFSELFVPEVHSAHEATSQELLKFDITTQFLVCQNKSLQIGSEISSGVDGNNRLETYC